MSDWHELQDEAMWDLAYEDELQECSSDLVALTGAQTQRSRLALQALAADALGGDSWQRSMPRVWKTLATDGVELGQVAHFLSRVTPLSGVADEPPPVAADAFGAAAAFDKRHVIDHARRPACLARTSAAPRARERRDGGRRRVSSSAARDGPSDEPDPPGSSPLIAGHFRLLDLTARRS
jgi:hypothetical protein